KAPSRFGREVQHEHFRRKCDRQCPWLVGRWRRPMSDFLLELSKNPNARKLIQTLGLPIPLPQSLERARGPWEERPLADRRVVVGSTLGGQLSSVLAVALASAGAEPILAPGWLDEAPFRAAGEAYGRPARMLDNAGDKPFWALVFDATGIKDPSG